MTSRYGEHPLRPLGSLAPPIDHPWDGAAIQRSPELSRELRFQVADYLSRASMFLPWMEYTRDVIGDRFGVSGGSAVCSDGTYFWRGDAVEYIKEYGIPVPDEAIVHFRNLDWQPPTFSRDEWVAIYKQLHAMFVDDDESGIVVFNPQ